MKTLKRKQAVHEDENPQGPSRLVETREIHDGHVKQELKPFWSMMLEMWPKGDFWRQQKKKYPTFGNF